jgi:hypothetical protein
MRPKYSRKRTKNVVFVLDVSGKSLMMLCTTKQPSKKMTERIESLHGMDRDELYSRFQNLEMQDELKAYSHSKSTQRIIRRIYAMH